ncbi:MAG: putative adhesin [Thermoplasmata archaeon]|jgi:hypothetical protein|nr:putative adhesin [Thermoplasmata archaeon]
MRAPLALVLFLLIVAGCIQPDPNATQPTRDAAPSGAAASMSAQESRNDTLAPCIEGINVGGGSMIPGALCAVRTITVTGTIQGIARLPVDLSTFSGPIQVDEANDGSWSLVAVLKARGTTPDEANANLAAIDFRWSHETAGAHEIRARAKMNQSQDAGYAAALALKVPRSVAMELSASDGSGAITVTGGATTSLSLSTGSGSIGAKTSIVDATLHTGSGSVDATLTPTASGDVSVSTGSGKVSLRLPEDAQHGYALTASTGSGGITIGLKDGMTSACPPSGPCDHRTFETSGYASRAIRAGVSLSTGSGAVDVQPA